jgi:hypothetical protein
MTEAHCPVVVIPRGVEGALEALLADAGRESARA